ncbi:ACT domain-containing protein [Marinomonas sp. 15G1-11]|uniref:ACT domain-containing protein n=1 Tax=Marinomonas phaeophyticola TaxID=3004091 RepID=A0ABT4JXU9_9GAMM|nr:ACT domain-containing protein [Marinomonas sp. 15G1-11]MCZ2723154.1 ACT domain-containing protein [Marinomonas sp. 15G1-11]
MSGEKNLQKLISSMTPVLLDKEFIYGTLSEPSLELLTKLTPMGTFHEEEGLTVILEKSIADEFNITYQGVFKCITLNVHSSLDAVGLTAAVATKLTELNISANVVAAYYHDHIFVALKDADSALQGLKALSSLA